LLQITGKPIAKSLASRLQITGKPIANHRQADCKSLASQMQISDHL
jgi:hypothetical protein